MSVTNCRLPIVGYQIVGYLIVSYQIVGYQIVGYQNVSYQIAVTKNPPVIEIEKFCVQ